MLAPEELRDIMALAGGPVRLRIQDAAGIWHEVVATHYVRDDMVLTEQWASEDYEKCAGFDPAMMRDIIILRR